ncbi:MAG: hypothetical protein IJJ74_08945 [Eubacterium sp.]|nr:hypothetical protein [Eubacterium sp.]
MSSFKLKGEDDLNELYYDKDDDRLQDINSEFAENVELPVIKTTSTYTGPKEKNHVGLIIKIVVLALLVVGAVFLVKKLIKKDPKELKDCVNMNTEQLEKELGIKLTRNDTTVKRVRHYSEGTLTTDGNYDVAVLYLDGKQLGIHIDSEKYKLYGIEIYMPRYEVEKKMTYEKENTMQILNDMYNGTSTSVFYYNTTKNDCIMVNYNDNTNRVVSMTYFNDFRRISERLNFN